MIPSQTRCPLKCSSAVVDSVFYEYLGRVLKQHRVWLHQRRTYSRLVRRKEVQDLHSLHSVLTDT
jgi:hypothetical protein